MNKEQLEQNIKEILELYKNIQSGIHDLLKWVKNDSEPNEILDEFLNFVWLENSEETRYTAYSRIVNLNEEPLLLYIDKMGLSDEYKFKMLDLAYDFVCNFYSEIQAMIITVIQSKKLLTPFYLEIFKWVANVWLAFNELFLPWKNHIINWVNKDLENEFQNDTDKIINFLNENNLFDLWHNWKIADRSYSALVKEEWKYKSKAYFEVFKNEITTIVDELSFFIENLSELEDNIYNAKEYYINYLKAIKEAFLETNTNLLLEKWAKVDEAWMLIRTPFQIGHPLEFYEDKYRKAVAPEWDLRIQNAIFESNIEKGVIKMHEYFYDEFWRDKYQSSYKFSLDNTKRVQLYLSTPILYYSSEFTWLFSAQVVPNDEVISQAFWKKIFAYPKMILENKRKTPFMKIDSIIFDETFLSNYKNILFWEDNIFYKIYDITTIGHEYWHNLWLDIDTQTLMNYKTWVFKNIEEFKATTWGLVMYFLNEEIASDLKEKIIIDHIYRCIKLLKYREVNEIEPYYCESLIHLQILFESWILLLNNKNKSIYKEEWVDEKYIINLCFNDETYKKLKEVYITHYKKLIKNYLNKIDAWEFLKDYTIKQELYYLPKSEQIRDFVEYYYWVYKDIWNEMES